ncbi:MAG: hypothetical protein JO122_13585 [Acetobacteraceae bacterium]|nr:hypothetical protein [Acetobacteraceae bacterium]
MPLIRLIIPLVLLGLAGCVSVQPPPKTTVITPPANPPATVVSPPPGSVVTQP